MLPLGQKWLETYHIYVLIYTAYISLTHIIVLHFHFVFFVLLTYVPIPLFNRFFPRDFSYISIISNGLYRAPARLVSNCESIRYVGCPLCNEAASPIITLFINVPIQVRTCVICVISLFLILCTYTDSVSV